MQFEIPFPKGFPEVGDVIKFTCKAITTVHGHGYLTAEEITGKRNWSTVEVMVVARQFDEATDLHYLITSDDAYKHISKLDRWESQGWMLSDVDSGRGLQFEKHRTLIDELEIVRKHT